LAEANRDIEAITKPNNMPDIVETAEAIGCISFEVKFEIVGHAYQQITMEIITTAI
jgi:nitrogen regulatory protein PII